MTATPLPDAALAMLMQNTDAMAAGLALPAAALAAAMMAAAVLDRLVVPGGRRSTAGLLLLLPAVAGVFGLCLALSGHWLLSAVMTVALAALLLLASNAKHRMLGEPLLFSDLALATAVFRHPQFYVSALAPWQRAVLVLAALLVAALLAALWNPAPAPHLAGAGLALVSWAGLSLLLRAPAWAHAAPAADAAADVAAHGLVATLLCHHARWRASPDPLPPPPLAEPAVADLIIIVQAESYADPVDIIGTDAPPLPGLAAARAAALLHGPLLVSGFGAYTMRTEYGVLFGRSEAELGLRRFDPYLTAHREGALALPARLRPLGWRSLFVHPHDLAFYERHRIMPIAGFDTLIGEEAFATPAPGRYVSDAAVAEKLLALAAAATGPTLLHAVTIENHGPWDAATAPAAAAAYRATLARSDAMLEQLMAGIAALRRPALLLFYGDHRPSIPGVTRPGGDRHTPYVLLQFDAAGQPVQGCGQPRPLSPAALHHRLLSTLLAAGDAGPISAAMPAAADP